MRQKVVSNEYVLCICTSQNTNIHIFLFSFSPDGKKIRSKAQLARLLGEAFDLSAFDFRTGRIIYSAVRKSKRQRGSPFDFAKGESQSQTAWDRLGGPPLIHKLVIEQSNNLKKNLIC